MVHILEAATLHEAKPTRRIALALQLFALTVLHHLALALAKLAQHLDVNAIFPEFLFHSMLANNPLKGKE